jgi:hypothetical protein
VKIVNEILLGITFCLVAILMIPVVLFVGLVIVIGGTE